MSNFGEPEVKPVEEAQEDGNPDPFGFFSMLGLRKHDAAASNVVEDVNRLSSSIDVENPIQINQLPPKLSEEQKAKLEEQAKNMQIIMEQKLKTLPKEKQELFKAHQEQLTKQVQEKIQAMSNAQGETGEIQPVFSAKLPEIEVSMDTQLIDSIRFKDLGKMVDLLKEMQKTLDYVPKYAADSMGHPLLHWAVNVDAVSILKYLLTGVSEDENIPNAQGMGRASVTQRNERGETALHWACLRGNIRCVHMLLESGADLHAADSSGYSALHHAAQHGRTLVAALVHRRGLDVDIRDNNNRTPLHWAVYKGEEMTASWLLDHGADLAAKDWEQCLPIHWAALQGNSALIKLLVKSGAGSHLHLMDTTNATPYMLASNKSEKYPQESFERRKFVNAAMLLKSVEANGGKLPNHRFKKIPHFSWFFWPVMAPIAFYQYYTIVFPVTSHYTILTMTLMIGYVLEWIAWLRLQFKEPGSFVINFGISTPRTGEKNNYAAVKAADTSVPESSTAIQINNGYDIRNSLPNPKVQGSTRYRELYELVLDQGLLVPVCTTCEIVKPIRSKHDRFTNRCVDKFDHFCPWMNCAIGRNNYPEFFFSMFFAMFALWAYVILLFLYTKHVDESKSFFQNSWAHLGFEASSFIYIPIALYSVLMVAQHSMFILNNITTNETMNRYRYTYLHGGNPFDQGKLSNLAEFLGFVKPKSLDVRTFYKELFDGMSVEEMNQARYGGQPVLPSGKKCSHGKKCQHGH